MGRSERAHTTYEDGGSQYLYHISLALHNCLFPFDQTESCGRKGFRGQRQGLISSIHAQDVGIGFFSTQGLEIFHRDTFHYFEKSSIAHNYLDENICRTNNR